MEQKINLITWTGSGASGAILVIAIIEKNPIYWAIGFCMLMVSILIYSGYRFFTRNEDQVLEEWDLPDSVLENTEQSVSGESSYLTNSQITAMCIQEGVTDPRDIAWVKEVPEHGWLSSNNQPLIISNRIKEILKLKQ